MLNITPLDLQSRGGHDLLASIAKLTSNELAAIAARLTRVFAIASPFAPGFRCAGGVVTLDDAMAAACGAPSMSVTGNGETFEAAVISCFGEAAELLSQIERPGDVGPRADDSGFVNEGWIAQAIQRAHGSIAWIDARLALNGAEAALPADICLRRAPARRAIQSVGALSSGVAAGPRFEAAANRAVLELCERDAAALWWLGGRRPSGFSLEHPASRAAGTLLEQLRQGVMARRTLLLNITTDIGVPSVAAVSFDHDGRGLACGLAARQTWEAAAKAAVLEMCQMELAVPVVEAKRAEAGEAKLNEADRRHLRRAAFAALDCELLRPHGLDAADAAVGDLAGHLAGQRIALFLLDLTRPDVGVPVVRAVSPQLQPFDGNVSTERFVAVQTDNPGAASAIADVPLLS